MYFLPHFVKTSCNKLVNKMFLMYIQRKGNWLVKETSDSSQQMRNGSNLSIQEMMNG
jgi:hypothetical protein